MYCVLHDPLRNFLFILSLLFFNICLFLRERETERERQRERERMGEGERETENPKLAPGSELSAQSLMRASNSQTVRP